MQFRFITIYTTSLCAQRSSKKCTSIACWTATLFLPTRGTMCSHKKSLAKKCFTIWSLRGVIITIVCYIMIQEIEQLANLKRTLRILANEWLVQWFQGFANVYYSARQIVPRRNVIVPHEMSVKIRRERRLLIALFLLFHSKYNKLFNMPIVNLM